MNIENSGLSGFSGERSPINANASARKIVEEEASQEFIQERAILIRNPFHKDRPNTEDKTISYASPEVKEFKEGRRDYRAADLITVRYADHRGRLIEDRWRMDEYLRRIGFSGDRKNNIKPFDRFKQIAASTQDLGAAMKAAQTDRIQFRIDRAYAFDKRLDDESKTGWEKKLERENQQRSQFAEDPFFAHTLEGSDYIYPVDLHIHHDYMDAIDVLVEIDLKDGFDDDWEEDPVYIGVQRTLLSKDSDRLRDKEEKIGSMPLWYLPEYPDRNPVLRVLYREDPEEYYLPDGSYGNEKTSKMDLLKEITLEENRRDPKRAKLKGAKPLRADSVLSGGSIKEIKDNYLRKDKDALEKGKLRMIAKTLDVLYQALDNVRDYISDPDRPPHMKKSFEKYERSIKRMISVIEDDNEMSREKIKELLSD